MKNKTSLNFTVISKILFVIMLVVVSYGGVIIGINYAEAVSVSPSTVMSGQSYSISYNCPPMIRGGRPFYQALVSAVGMVTSRTGPVNATAGAAGSATIHVECFYRTPIETVTTGSANLTILPTPINCVGAWTAWSGCSPSCGDGSQSKRYNVSVPASGGGDACLFANGQTQIQPCNNGACVANVDCVGSWSSYGSCSAACGGGNRTRTYTVTTPASGTGAACPFANGQTLNQSCNTGACASPVVLNCGGYWTSYGSCSASCGGGTRSRNFIVTQLPQNGGAACPSSPQTTSCNTGACEIPTPTPTPVPVVTCAGSWSSYGSCSASCGPGNRTRTYTVNTPASGGGTACPFTNGETDSISCDAGACANISATNCSIPTGDSSCNVNVNWSSSFTDNPISVRQDGIQFSSAANSGGTSRSVLFGDPVFSFFDNGSELSSYTANASCAPGTIWVSPICRLDIGPALTPGGDIEIVISPDQTIFQSGTTIDVFGEVSTTYDLDCELSALAQTQSFSTPTVTTSNPINGQLRNQNTFTLTCNTQPDEAFSDGSTSVSVTRIVEVVPTFQEI